MPSNNPYMIMLLKRRTKFSTMVEDILGHCFTFSIGREEIAGTITGIKANGHKCTLDLEVSTKEFAGQSIVKISLDDDNNWVLVLREQSGLPRLVPRGSLIRL